MEGHPRPRLCLRNLLLDRFSVSEVWHSWLHTPAVHTDTADWRNRHSVVTATKSQCESHHLAGSGARAARKNVILLSVWTQWRQKSSATTVSETQLPSRKARDLAPCHLILWPA